MYDATYKVLEYLSDHSPSTRSRSEVGGIYKTITTFEFVFILHLMRRILAIADVLCQSLQKKTQNILTAMRFVCTTKTILQALREDGWEEFLKDVKCFCSKNDIHVPGFDGSYMVGHSCGREYPTIEHHYHFDIFNAAIDFQMMELDTRFNETSIEFLSLNETIVILIHYPNIKDKKRKLKSCLSVHYNPIDYYIANIHTVCYLGYTIKE
ncbi:uncharacterized protein LOC111406784 [Olea europaea var. sylvestris]|uniref:uncharacterized protein LOC111406784 n=1 Tax=Olea europaea var. sylvestris TaxID=158386 RepID=UPI000C1D74F9|nr:uncharacterized protein LOC111406784 [Olea europaea var. sylvestris]